MLPLLFGGHQLCEVPAHPALVRSVAGDHREGCGRLADGHVAAWHGRAAELPRSGDELGDRRAVHDIRDPLLSVQCLGGHRAAGVVVHADRAGVDETGDGSRGEEAFGVGDIRGHCADVAAAAQAFAQLDGTSTIGVGDGEGRRAEPGQPVGHCRTGAAGSELQNVREVDVPEGRLESEGETAGVGVVADESAVADEHRVDGADALGLRAQLVEMGDDQLLARVGDVESVEPELDARAEKLSDVIR